MRERFGRFGSRRMARRPGDGEGFTLSPRARWIVGWIAALLLVVGVAFAVGILGGNGDGTPVGASPGQSGSAPGDPAPIAFGTALDDSTGRVAEQAAAARFTGGDTFAYSVDQGAGTVPGAVYVEVRRTAGGDAGVVQEPVNAQALADPAVIAFAVPADDLIAAFGPGTYEMLIYAEPGGDPLAEGQFELAAAEATASPT